MDLHLKYENFGLIIAAVNFISITFIRQLSYTANNHLKKLFIIRHAKSNQDFFGNDFERPLNERGKKDAPEMAKRLLVRSGKPAALVSSPAARAKKTATLFAETFQIPSDEIIFVTALYHAPAQVFYEVIASLPDSFDSVAIFAHNPGITYFVNSLEAGISVDNMPTCAVFAVSADTEKWEQFAWAKKEALFFDYPKNSF